MTELFAKLQNRLELLIEKFKPEPHPAVVASRQLVDSLSELTTLGSEVEKTVVRYVAQPSVLPLPSECLQCPVYREKIAKQRGRS